jgi:hypothetical protein
MVVMSIVVMVVVVVMVAVVVVAAPVVTAVVHHRCRLICGRPGGWEEAHVLSLGLVYLGLIFMEPCV